MNNIEMLANRETFMPAALIRHAARAAWIRLARVSAKTLVMAILLASPAVAAAHVSGSGVEKLEVRTLEKFDKIEASASAVLQVAVGASETSVVVTGDDNVVPLVKTTVVGGVLRIHAEEGHSNRLPVVVKIALPRLAAIETSGASRITVTGLSGERFRLDGSGSTQATISGAIDSLEIDISGAGRVNATNLAARRAEIVTSGAGHVEVNARDELRVSVSGVGKITYLGNPTITKTISGVASIVAKK